MDQGKIRSVLKEYFVLTVATLILVVGVYVFKFPNNFSFGGVTGIAVVLGAITPLLRVPLRLSLIWHCWYWDFSSLERTSVLRLFMSVY